MGCLGVGLFGFIWLLPVWWCAPGECWVVVFGLLFVGWVFVELDDVGAGVFAVVPLLLLLGGVAESVVCVAEGWAAPALLVAVLEPGFDVVPGWCWFVVWCWCGHFFVLWLVFGWIYLVSVLVV